MPCGMKEDPEFTQWPCEILNCREDCGYWVEETQERGFDIGNAALHIPGKPCPRCGKNHEPHEDAACGCGCGENPIGCIGCTFPVTDHMLRERYKDAGTPECPCPGCGAIDFDLCTC